MKKFILFLALILSFSVKFSYTEAKNNCSQKVQNRFCILSEVEYEAAKISIYDEKTNRQYGPIWGSRVAKIAIGTKGLYVLTEPDGRAESLYLCRNSGTCGFLMSSEQLQVTYPGIEKIYDFELLTLSRVRIFIIKPGSDIIRHVFRVK